MKYKVVSLFAGCGGFDLGFIQAGFEIIWANERNKDAVNTYIKNIGNHVQQGDITKILNSEITNDFDVLIGGFPCQGFSLANNKRSMKDERNFLYKELIRILKNKRPKFFVSENVKGLLSILNGKVLNMIVEDFKSLGYTVDFKVLKASDYGVPQHRERIIIIGNRIGVKNLFPTPTHSIETPMFFTGLKPYVNVKDAIEHLSSVRTRQEPFKLKQDIVYNHVAKTKVESTFWTRKSYVKQAEICEYLKEWKNKSPWTIKQIDQELGYTHTAGHWFRKDNNWGSIPNVKDWWALKKLLNFDDKYDQAVTDLILKEITFEQSLRVSNWDRPSDTITATSPEIHPNKKRRLSVRECAILQSFPNSFVFQGSLTEMYKQVGNAVPVQLSFKIAQSIKEGLSNEQRN